MKDRIFSGTDVEEALAAAGATLGLPVAKLRYVVLEAGTEGGRGLQATPTRIAVLIQEHGDAGSGRAGMERPVCQEPGPREAPDARAGLRRVVQAVADAGGLAVAAEIEETTDAVVLHLRGKDGPFFIGEDGRGEALLALEHLVQRMHGSAFEPLALRLRCEGFRERRDAALGAEAHLLAEAVRADGVPRTMVPLNAYDRRVVHLSLQGDPVVTTYSVGEGRERRVTVACKVPPIASAPGGEDETGR